MPAVSPASGARGLLNGRNGHPASATMIDMNIAPAIEMAPAAKLSTWVPLKMMTKLNARMA